MNIAAIQAFACVTQWQFLFRNLTPSEIVSKINEIHREGIGDSIHGKIKRLWKMEALGVYWGIHGGCCPTGYRIREQAQPIVQVGIGAGLVTRFGFDANVIWSCIEASGELWAWEGVGHMLGLQYHPVIAWLLGMPRPRVCESEFLAQFPAEIEERIQFGMQRMAWLCGEGWAEHYPGAQFAGAMLRHREWSNDPGCEIKGVISARVYHFRGEQAAREFIEMVWPNTGREYAL